MLKLNILNMEGFLYIVNSCNGEINMLYLNGDRENINNNEQIQKFLLQKFEENKNFLSIILDIPNSKDYLKIVCGSIENYY